MIALQAYYGESWFTAEGARLKRRRLEAAGIPDFTNWRFISLTIASRSISPLGAYRLGRARMRRFLARFRKAIGRRFKWCWKLEFHEDGYPHWHLPAEYLRKIPEEMLVEMEKWWGLGRINVKRIRGEDMEYLFKYATKAPEELPAWVMEHRGRIRVFQTCAGFFTRSRSKPRQKKEPRTCLVPVSLRTRQGWDTRKALLIEEAMDGSRQISVVKLRKTFNALLLERARRTIIQRDTLTAPGVVFISQRQLEELKYEQRKFAGLAGIPCDAAAA